MTKKNKFDNFYENMRIQTLFYALSFIFFFFTVSISYAEKATLKKTLEIALKHSFLLDVAQKELQIAQLDLTNKKYWFTPQLNAVFQSTQGNLHFAELENLNPNFFDIKPPGFYTGASLQLQETLYNNGKSITDLHIAQCTLSRTQIENQKTRDDLILSIIEEFSNYSAIQAKYMITCAQEQAVEKQYEAIQREFKSGMKAKNNFIRAKALLKRIQLEVKTLHTNFFNSKLALTQLVNSHDPQLDFEPYTIDASMLQYLEDTTDTIEKKSLLFENTYTFQIGQINLEIYALETQYAKQAYYPQWNVTTQATVDRQIFPTPPTSPIHWEFALNVKWNIWDWGILNRSLQIAKITQQKQEKTTYIDYNKTQTDMRQLQFTLGVLKSNLILQKELLSIEEESNTIFIKQFKRGEASWLDLINSLNDFFKARINLIEAQFALLKAIAKIRFFEGNISEILDHLS